MAGPQPSRRKGRLKEIRPKEHRVGDEFVGRFCLRKGWRYLGYDLIRNVEAWAVRHPKDVAVVHVDDDHHATAILVAILHRRKNRLWGTTVYYITQNDRVEPVQFFMYPQRSAQLERVCAAIRRFGPWNSNHKDIVKIVLKEATPRYFRGC